MPHRPKKEIENMNRLNFYSVIMSHGYIYVYAYDKGGNRETEKIYAFTTGDTLGEVLETKTSQYNYLVWKDRLSSYDGKQVKYDSAGNPTSYDGKTYKWDGRNLKEITLSDGSKTQFEYDQDGLRTQKRQYKADGGLDYFVDYIWEDGKLVYQYLTLAVYVTNSQGVTTMHEFGPFTVKIIYDDSGLPQGFMVNDSAEYAFVRNLQGDVIAMIDQNGETVMEYSYDPWGKIEYHLSDTIEDEETAKLITALCPLTYRGYNYDFTTGLYYLQSRYYNPEWGRFLNCDNTNILLATQGETHNANLFAYCDNNPVNKTDYDGKCPLEISNMNVYVSIYGGALGHAEIWLGSLIFSYGAYGTEGYSYTRKATIGCPATVIVAYNPLAWHSYDKARTGNRYREDIYIKVNYEEFINLLVFCISLVLCSEYIISRNWISGTTVIDSDNIEQTDWDFCRLGYGKYKTYHLLLSNCVCVVDEALHNAMPDRYKMALTRAVISNPTGSSPFVMTPEQFGSFLKLYFK